MALSPEVQAQADEIRRNKSLVKSLQAERDLWRSKAMDAQGQLDTLAGKREMSAEDREELKRQAAELDALNDELEGAAQDNTKPEPIAGGAGGATDTPAPAKVEAEPIPDDASAARPDPLPGTARGDGAPLMPNMAFDPDPTGNKGVGDAGQPNQAQAIETPGGFVVSGGGSTQRAPGSDPASPSSTLVVPDGDPVPVAAEDSAGTADIAPAAPPQESLAETENPTLVETADDFTDDQPKDPA